MTNSRKKILVLSPHLDDAVLSCGDYILDWKKQGHEVTVITIFTKFQDKYISKSARDSLKAGGFMNAKECERIRKEEDRNAMKLLDVPYQHLDFIDGWFRVLNNKPLYKDQTLFSGKISSSDTQIIDSLGKKLSKYIDFDQVYIPLGIGKHVDHVITKNVASEIFNKETIRYYCDQPYAQKIRNWNFRLIVSSIIRIASVLNMSLKKRTLLDCYPSQMSQLFSGHPKFSEILLRG